MSTMDKVLLNFYHDFVIHAFHINLKAYFSSDIEFLSTFKMGQSNWLPTVLGNSTPYTVESSPKIVK